MIGQKVKFRIRNAILSGRVIDVFLNNIIAIKTDDGHIHVIDMKEIIL